MKYIAIIGAGQLGSRHLQGLVKYPEKLRIYVLDPAADALKIAQERESQINHTNEVIYGQSWEILPDFLDLTIVATNASIRESVITRLLEKHEVKFLVLEKVLFQDLEAYQRVGELLVKNNITTYVNHPRRMFESYNAIKKNFLSHKSSVFQVAGGNWGLGCNALHFLDFFVYMSGKKIQSIDVTGVDEELIDSTRKGFIEFTGTISGKLDDDSCFSITSFKGDPSAITVTLFNDTQRYLVQEGGTAKSYKWLANESFACIQEDFKIQFQSELTTIIAEDLFKAGVCSLPNFEEARHVHELFIRVMLEKYNKITKLRANILPIT